MVTVTNWDSKLNQLLGNIRDALAELAFTPADVTNFNSKTELLLAEIRDLIAAGGGGDITGSGAATQIAVFDAAKNIIGYVPLKFLKAATTAIREQLIVGSPGVNNSSGSLIIAINPTTNSNPTSAGFAVQNSDGDLDFGMTQFSKNYPFDDGIGSNGYFERTAAARRRSAMIANGFPIGFFAPEFLFGVPTYNSDSVGIRHRVNSGMRVGMIEDILGDNPLITAALDLSGKNQTKAPLRLRPQAETNTNINPGNIEFTNDNEIKVAHGTTIGSKKTLAYKEDLVNQDFFIRSFVLEIVRADLKAGGDFPIPEFPAVPDAVWSLINCDISVIVTDPFNGNPNIEIRTESANNAQCNDSNLNLLQSVDTTFARIIPIDSKRSMLPNKGLIVRITNPSTIGSGEIKIYGLARLITL